MGDQGVGDQGVGDQGVGDQGVGDQRLGDQGVGDQGVEGTIMSLVPLYPVQSKKVKTLTVPGRASFSPPGQVISITFHCNRQIVTIKYLFLYCNFLASQPSCLDLRPLLLPVLINH